MSVADHRRRCRQRRRASAPGSRRRSRRSPSWTILDHALVRVPRERRAGRRRARSHLDARADASSRCTPRSAARRPRSWSRGATAPAVGRCGSRGPLREVDVVLVHDAARALTPTEVFDRVTDAVRATGGGVIPVLPVTDTVKRVARDGRRRNRRPLRPRRRADAAGVPARRARSRAYAVATADHTDDAALFAAAGHAVSTVAGRRAGVQDHRPPRTCAVPSYCSDRTGRSRAVGAASATTCTPTTRPRPLALGGLDWPGEPGLAGHSDGDAIIHAIVDALLSAAGLGDIGSDFGTDDPVRRRRERGLPARHPRASAPSGSSVVNVAVQVVGDHPKIGPRRAEARGLAQRAGRRAGLGERDDLRPRSGSPVRGLGAIATALLPASALRPRAGDRRARCLAGEVRAAPPSAAAARSFPPAGDVARAYLAALDDEHREPWSRRSRAVDDAAFEPEVTSAARAAPRRGPAAVDQFAEPVGRRALIGRPRRERRRTRARGGRVARRRSRSHAIRAGSTGLRAPAVRPERSRTRSRAASPGGT